MSTGDIHTVPHGDGWANKIEGNDRVSRTYDTQADASVEGRRWAVERDAEHFIHGVDGQIRERNTYPRSRDPRSSKG
jgi:hypothetical protein